MDRTDGVNVTPADGATGQGIDGQAGSRTSSEADQRQQEAAVPGTVVGTVPGAGEHYRVAVRHAARSLLPIVMGTPLCGRCNVAWPCPSVAAVQGLAYVDNATEPVRKPLTAVPATLCRACRAPWPCPTAARRTGMPLSRGGDEHQPEQVA